jgi:orotate phosphoribosyltransferase
MDDNPIKTRYLSSIFDPIRYAKTFRQSFRILRALKKDHPFDAIAVRGVSGMALGFALAHKLKVGVICVRKSETKAHSKLCVEGFVGAKRYVIVDDLVDNGETVKYIVREIKVEAPQAICVAGFFYSSAQAMDRYKDLGMPLTIGIVTEAEAIRWKNEGEFAYAGVGGN